MAKTVFRQQRIAAENGTSGSRGGLPLGVTLFPSATLLSRMQALIFEFQACSKSKSEEKDNVQLLEGLYFRWLRGRPECNRSAPLVGDRQQPLRCRWF
jgi:hypothetical protein